MALIYAEVPDSEDFWGHKKRKLIDVTLDDSYPANGYTLDEFRVAVGPIEQAQQVGGNIASAGLLFNYVSGKLVVMYPTGGAEDSPSALAAPAITEGGSGGDSATFTIVPGVGKQVLATTDLSTITVRLQVIGKG